MKLILLILILFTGASVALAEVTDSIDRFTGHREINAVHRPTSADHLFMSAFVKIFKESMHERPLIIVILSQLHAGTQYSECPKVDWLADDQPFTIPVRKHQAKEVKDGFVIEEVILAEVREADFRKIASASKVEYRICRDEFALSAEELADVRKIVELMPPPFEKGK